jgi:exodeoxyribonuclease VII large subunit
LKNAAQDALDAHAQRLDAASRSLTRPRDALAQQRLRLQQVAFSLKQKLLSFHEHSTQEMRRLEANFSQKTQLYISTSKQRHQRAAQALEHLNPQRVLERGFAVLQGSQGEVIKSRLQAKSGQRIAARVADGEIGLSVQ